VCVAADALLCCRAACGSCVVFLHHNVVLYLGFIMPHPCGTTPRIRIIYECHPMPTNCRVTLSLTTAILPHSPQYIFRLSYTRHPQRRLGRLATKTAGATIIFERAKRVVLQLVRERAQTCYAHALCCRQQLFLFLLLTPNPPPPPCPA